MSVALVISSLYVGAVCLFGFIVSQIFFDFFSLASSVIGIAGLATAVGGFKLSEGGHAPAWIEWSSVFALLGLAFSAVDYYVLSPAMPGNNFAWWIKAPLAAGLVFIGVIAFRRHRRSAAEA